MAMQRADIQCGVLYWVQIGLQAVRVCVIEPCSTDAYVWECEHPDGVSVICGLDQFLTKDMWQTTGESTILEAIQQ